MTDEELQKMLAEAFKAGWKERDKNPGLKRVSRRSFGNSILLATGGARYAEVDYVKDHRRYHHSIWLNSSFKRELNGSN